MVWPHAGPLLEQLPAHAFGCALLHLASDRTDRREVGPLHKGKSAAPCGGRCAQTRPLVEHCIAPLALRVTRNATLRRGTAPLYCVCNGSAVPVHQYFSLSDPLASTTAAAGDHICNSGDALAVELKCSMGCVLDLHLGLKP